jgi:mono/diheme cytochrome c family protein
MRRAARMPRSLLLITSLLFALSCAKAPPVTSSSPEELKPEQPAEDAALVEETTPAPDQTEPTLAAEPSPIEEATAVAEAEPTSPPPSSTAVKQSAPTKRAVAASDKRLEKMPDPPPTDKPVAITAPAVDKQPAPAYRLVPVAAPDKKTERVWKSKCASCHGMDGRAATEQGKKMLVSDMTPPAWQTSRSNERLKKAIREGVKGEKGGVKQEMDGYKDDLTAEQLEGVLKYTRWVGAPK